MNNVPRSCTIVEMFQKKRNRSGKWNTPVHEEDYVAEQWETRIGGTRYRFYGETFLSQRRGIVQRQLSFSFAAYLPYGRDKAWLTDQFPTGHKNAIKVFSSVAHFLRTLLRKYSIDFIEFGSHESHRENLYLRFARVIAKELHGKVEIVTGPPSYCTYWIVLHDEPRPEFEILREGKV